MTTTTTPSTSSPKNSTTYQKYWDCNVVFTKDPSSGCFVAHACIKQNKSRHSTEDMELHRLTREQQSSPIPRTFAQYERLSWVFKSSTMHQNWCRNICNKGIGFDKLTYVPWKTPHQLQEGFMMWVKIFMVCTDTKKTFFFKNKISPTCQASGLCPEKWGLSENLQCKNGQNRNG